MHSAIHSRPQWHKRWILIAATLSLVILPACTSLGLLPPQEPVTIKFLYAGGSTAYYEMLLEEFNQDYPHITVELTGWRGFGPTAIEEYDVFAISQYQFPFMREGDAIRPLNALIEQDEDFDLNDFYPGTVNAFSIEGQRWALPMGVNMLVMCYNRDLFDRVNAPYPEVGWTWDDFLARAILVSNANAGIFGYAYHMSGNLGMLEPMTFIYQHGGQLYDSLQAPTRMIFNDPLNVQAMDWYGRLIHEHRVAPGPGERSLPYPDSGIEKGKFAMWMCWYTDEREANWSVAPLPRDVNGSAMGSTMGLVIAKETSNAEAGWEWATFLSNQIPQGLMPARRSLAESKAYTTLVGEENAITGRAAVNELMQLNLSMEGQLGMTWGKAMGALNSALTMIRGGEDAQTALDAAQKQSGF